MSFALPDQPRLHEVQRTQLFSFLQVAVKKKGIRLRPVLL